jgi:Na+/proline symporter
MQKNISVKNLKDSRKNMISFSFVLLLVNFLFLFLGGLLYLYLKHEGAAYEGHQFLIHGKNVIGDDLFPTIALQYLPKAVALIFVIGLILPCFSAMAH